MTELTVWWSGRRVGRLSRAADGLLAFAYTREWLRDGHEISCSLPLTGSGEFFPPDRRAHHFFGNLLPEGNARDRLVRKLGIADDDFALLMRFGGDCAGALSLLPDDEPPPDSAGELRALTDNELKQAIRDGGTRLLVEGERAPRLSLAGAQDKMPVCIVPVADHSANPALLLPLGGRASTHILKLPVSDFRHVPLFEAYTAFIATQMQLPVADIVPLPIGNQVCSLSTRYDRRVVGAQVVRLHQEDFCQALGRSRNEKYGDEGAHAGLMAGVLREHGNSPARDLRLLIAWQVFNALAGNADGHLKNLSLLADARGGWQLAPFYDLVCTLAIARVSHRMALPVGDLLDPRQFTQTHWQAFAAQIGVRPRAVTDVIRELAGRLHEGLAGWHLAFQEKHGEQKALQRPYQVMQKQAQRAVKGWV